MDIDANVKSIDKLKEYFFVVPDYQREYVWKADDQVEQFLVDIDNEYDPAAKIQSNYFIGSIIVVKNEKNQRFEVIDGQQRLTTIVISLCVLRDLLKTSTLDTNQNHYFDLIKGWLFSFDPNNDEVQIRLDLQYEESKDFLTRLINEKPYEGEKTASILKMQSAYDRIKTHFSGYLKGGIDALVKYARYFVTHIDLVVIESKNISSALKIFETINQRGAGLNAMDLVKNLLFSEAKESEFNKIKESWKQINKNLMACGEEQSPLRFLRYFLMARYHNGILREDEIYKWIISPDGKKALNYQANPLALVKELEVISKRYADLVQATQLMGDGGEFPSVTNIGFINKTKSRQHLILMLALPVNSDNLTIEYLGSQIESFLFYSNTIGIDAKNNERLFSQWVEKLRDVKNMDEVSKAIEITFLPYLQEKFGAFKQTFLTIRHDAYSPQYRERFILGRLENTALEACGFQKKGRQFFNMLQVEHIFPQTPKEGVLPTEFPDQFAYFAMVYRLGNVTLLEGIINQAVNKFNDLQGDWFQKKQNEYLKSDVVTTKLLSVDHKVGVDTALNRYRSASGYRFEQWNSAAVETRQKILLDLALDTWRINGKRLDQIVLSKEKNV